MFKIIKNIFMSKNDDFETVTDIRKKAKPQEKKIDLESKIDTEESVYQTDNNSEYLQKVSQGIELLCKVNKEKCRKVSLSPDHFLSLDRYSDLIDADVLCIDTDCKVIHYDEAYSYFKQRLGLSMVPEIKFGIISSRTKLGDKYNLEGKQNFSINISSYKYVWYLEVINGYFTIDITNSEFIYAEKRYWKMDTEPNQCSFTCLRLCPGPCKRYLSLRLKLKYKGNNILVPTALIYSVVKITTSEIPETTVETLTGHESYQEIQKKLKNWERKLVAQHNIEPDW